jgi:hypothetical protein
MFNLRLGISLISMASLASIFLWFATTPGLSLEQTSSPQPLSPVAKGDGATFAGRIKATLSEAAEGLPPEIKASQTIVPSRMKVSRSTDEKPRDLLKAPKASSYGVNEEFIKHACTEFIRQTP